jgi:hypothetical protein
VEDYTGRDENPFYELAEARERIVAVAEAAHGGPVGLELTPSVSFRSCGDQT